MSLRAVALLALSLAATACSVNAEDAPASSADAVSAPRRVTALRASDARSELASIIDIAEAHAPNATVRILSTFGGDPAVNGVHPILVVDRDGAPRKVYDLGMNISLVSNVAWFGGDAGIDLTFRYDAVETDGAVSQHEGRARISDVLATPSMFSEYNDGERYPVETLRTMEPARAAAFADVVGMTLAEDEITAVRFLSLAGNDDANSTRVFAAVSVGDEAKVFDLGLGVRSVMDAEMAASGASVRLRGEEDVRVGGRPTVRSFRIDFGFTSTDDTVGGTATVTRR